MIKSSSKISWLEAVSILTVSQIFATVAYSSQSLYGLSAASIMIAFAAGTLMNFLVIIPFAILNSKAQKKSILEHSYRCFGYVACIFSVAIFLSFIAVSVNTVVVFQKFLSDTVYQSSSNFVIIFLLVLAASYGTFLGIEALGRVANIIFLVISLAILVVTFSVIKDIKWQNIGNVYLSDAKSIFTVALKGVASNTGILAAFVLLPNINQNIFKGFCLWNVFSLVIVEIITATVSGVLGVYGIEKAYPYYTTTTIAEFSVIKRLDIIYLCIWVFVAFVKTTFYLFLSKKTLDKIFHKHDNKFSLIFCSGLVLLLSYVASVKGRFSHYIKSFVSSGWIFIVIVILLPITLLFFTSKKRGAKNAND